MKSYTITQKLLSLPNKLIYIMGNKALRIFLAVMMTLAIIALVVFMIVHIRAGLDGVNAKLLLAAYVLMIIWAGFRLLATIRSLSGK